MVLETKKEHPSRLRTWPEPQLDKENCSAPALPARTVCFSNNSSKCIDRSRPWYPGVHQHRDTDVLYAVLILCIWDPF